MADYITTDIELTSIADAIRTKGGTSASLVYPAEFVSAIEAIPTGGGGGGDTHLVVCNTYCQVLTSSGASIGSTGTWSNLGGSGNFAAGDTVVVRVPSPGSLKYTEFTVTPSVQDLKLFAYSSTVGYAVFTMPDSDVSVSAR